MINMKKRMDPRKVRLLFVFICIIGLTFIFLLYVCYQELANSLDKQTRENISTFIDAIEEILVQKMRAELQFSDNTREK